MYNDKAYTREEREIAIAILKAMSGYSFSHKTAMSALQCVKEQVDNTLFNVSTQYME